MKAYFCFQNETQSILNCMCWTVHTNSLQPTWLHVFRLQEKTGALNRKPTQHTNKNTSICFCDSAILPLWRTVEKCLFQQIHWVHQFAQRHDRRVATSATDTGSWTLRLESDLYLEPGMYVTFKFSHLFQCWAAPYVSTLLQGIQQKWQNTETCRHPLLKGRKPSCCVSPHVTAKCLVSWKAPWF